MSDRNIKAFRTFALADVDDGTSCVQLSELEGGSLRFSTSGDIDHGGAFDVPPDAVAGLVDFVAPGHREALAVLAELAKAEEELQARYETCTTCARPEDLLRAWLAEMRARAKSVLAKAGVR